MQENQFTLSQQWSKKKGEDNADAIATLKEENQKLLLENAELKKKLEKEKLFHSTLYKQWTDLNAQIISKKNELKVRQHSNTTLYKYAFFGLLLLTVILAALAYRLSPGKDKATAVIQNIESVTGPQPPNTKSPATPRVKKEAGTSDKKKAPNAEADRGSSGLPATKPAAQLTPLGKYRIAAKSYFCNEPDESTRRSTFVLPDNSDYGIVTALDDRNGFIYIEFTNHAGRISKGWILKADLERIY